VASPVNPAVRLTAAALFLGAIVFAIFFLDRPLALFSYGHFHHARAPFVALTHFVDLLEIAAVGGLFWVGVKVARGETFGPSGLVALRATLAYFLAAGVKPVAKYAFGRTWPETWTHGNPSFIRDGAYGFTPFHGGAGWGAFPSGHETLVCAVAACLWVAAPRLRPVYALAVVLVGLGLLGADYHWLSDVLAGGLLGWMTGLFAARLNVEPCD
jgi:membrane-associated phospholipid phosphatase